MNQRLHTISGFKNRLINTFLIAVLLYSCQSEDNAEKKKTETKQTDDPPTQVFALKKGRLSSSLQIPGELIAYQQVDLYAKVNSFVKKLYVDVGSEVKEGELLATMEAPELNSQLAGAESAIKSREAIYLASKANYDRMLETSKTPGTISPNDLEQAAARKNSDFAQFQAAQSASQRNYGNTELSADTGSVQWGDHSQKCKPGCLCRTCRKGFRASFIQSAGTEKTSAGIVSSGSVYRISES